MELSEHKIRTAVRNHYRSIVAAPAETDTAAAACCTSAGCCCGSQEDDAYGSSACCEAEYTSEDLRGVPEEAILGLGCGNPVRFAEIHEGDRVLDLGSGGGIDCFIAAKRAGSSGCVIGVDMTPEMIDRARRNAQGRAEYANVEFRLGEIEHLPVADGSVDLVISNCVVNLSLDKQQVYREAFRVLAPGGRVVISDMVALRALPPELLNDPEAYASCISGAESVAATRDFLELAGFHDIEITLQEATEVSGEKQPFVASALIRARRPH